ncbi:MAG: hypothetical protein H0V24_14975 [Chloroflexia bacterium]|nr:hypothetical protein [Chloroflexia bacterium]
MSQGVEHGPRIAFLLGKPPRDATVISDLLEFLRAIPIEVRVHLPKGDEPLPPWLFDSDLVAQRGLGIRELTSALRLEAVGVRCCNRIAATITLCDREATGRKLAAVGIPVPATRAAASWPELLALADGRPIAVKTADGSIGRGLGVAIAADERLPAREPFAAPFLAQDYILSDGQVYKLCIVGRQALGLLKSWPPRPAADGAASPFPVDAELTELSRRVGSALDLEIYGVDVLIGPNGPVIVDVNPFSGFRGVPGAVRLIARHLTAIASGQDPA